MGLAEPQVTLLVVVTSPSKCAWRPVVSMHISLCVHIRRVVEAVAPPNRIGDNAITAASHSAAPPRTSANCSPSFRSQATDRRRRSGTQTRTRKMSLRMRTTRCECQAKKGCSCLMCMRARQSSSREHGRLVTVRSVCASRSTAESGVSGIAVSRGEVDHTHRLVVESEYEYGPV